MVSHFPVILHYLFVWLLTLKLNASEDNVQTQENIAFDRPASQSSTHASKDATKAVDGKTDTCSETQSQRGEWWQLELQRSVEVERFRIISDLKRITNSRSYREIRVSEVSIDNPQITEQEVWKGASVCREKPSLGGNGRTCIPSVKGRYVIVKVLRKIVLKICEFQIYRCRGGWFGPSCEHKCHCKSKTEACNKTSGFCQSGCAYSFSGQNCLKKDCSVLDKETNKWVFGDDVCHECNCENKQERCHHLTGRCNQCARGYTNIDCLTVCPHGQFGFNCSSFCHCLDPRKTCNVATGYGCGSCAARYKGRTCSTANPPCSPRKFGPSCNRICNCINDTDICDRTTGKCPYGCAGDYVGDACEELSGALFGLSDIVIGMICVGAGLFIMIVTTTAIYFRARRKKHDHHLRTEETPLGELMRISHAEECIPTPSHTSSKSGRSRKTKKVKHGQTVSKWSKIRAHVNEQRHAKAFTNYYHRPPSYTDTLKFDNTKLERPFKKYITKQNTSNIAILSKSIERIRKQKKSKSKDKDTKYNNIDLLESGNVVDDIKSDLDQIREEIKSNSKGNHGEDNKLGLLDIVENCNVIDDIKSDIEQIREQTAKRSEHKPSEHNEVVSHIVNTGNSSNKIKPQKHPKHKQKIMGKKSNRYEKNSIDQ